MIKPIKITQLRKTSQNEKSLLEKTILEINSQLIGNFEIKNNGTKFTSAILDVEHLRDDERNKLLEIFQEAGYITSLSNGQYNDENYTLTIKYN
jgi:hypothetical protein